MNLVEYDPTKHDLEYDADREEIIFIFADGADFSLKIDKQCIADLNNVISSTEGHYLYIDGHPAEYWRPSNDQMMNCLLEAERHVFDPMFRFKLELTIASEVLLDHLDLLTVTRYLKIKTNVSHKELVLS